MANNSTSAINLARCLPETFSRCVTGSVTAAHSFEVSDFSLLDGMGIGKYVSSSTFSVGGYDWNIRFYPDGLKDSEGNPSAFLFYLSPAKDVRTKFTFFYLLEKDGEIQLTNFNVLEHIFSTASCSFGNTGFVKKSKLKSSSGLNSGCFTIRCDLTVIKEPRTEGRRNLVVVPQPNLHNHLERMLKYGEGADVTFSVRGQLFNAHRCVLAARSPVLKAELFGPMKEKATQRIKVDDIEPPVFEALLHFVYTDSMLDDYKEGSTANMQHLLVAADRYGVDRLRAMCEGKLSESIDVETVATTLVLAEQHHCTQLREACIGFMASSRDVLGAVVRTDGFDHLVASCPLVMKEILDKVSRVWSEY